MSAIETRDRHERQTIAIWAAAGDLPIGCVREPFYRAVDCFSCAHIGPENATPDGTFYLFCGHVWDTVWGSDVEGRADLARDLAATLIAAADATGSVTV